MPPLESETRAIAGMIAWDPKGFAEVNLAVDRTREFAPGRHADFLRRGMTGGSLWRGRRRWEVAIFPGRRMALPGLFFLAAESGALW